MGATLLAAASSGSEIVATLLCADSNDQLTAETLAFSSYKTNQNNL
jgi:hypothetical protein